MACCFPYTGIWDCSLSECAACAKRTCFVQFSQGLFEKHFEAWWSSPVAYLVHPSWRQHGKSTWVPVTLPMERAILCFLQAHLRHSHSYLLFSPMQGRVCSLLPLWVPRGLEHKCHHSVTDNSRRPKPTHVQTGEEAVLRVKKRERQRQRMREEEREGEDMRPTEGLMSLKQDY